MQNGIESRYFHMAHARGALGWLLLALACGATASALAAPGEDSGGTTPASRKAIEEMRDLGDPKVPIIAGRRSGELAPMIPRAAHEELKFGNSDLSVVIAVDEEGNYRIYRSRNAKEDAKVVDFPIKGGGVSSMETFTIFKTNPSCLYVGGTLICW